MREVYESRLARSRAPLRKRTTRARARGVLLGLREELLRAERRAVTELHERGELPEEALQRIQRDLDLDEARLV